MRPIVRLAENSEGETVKALIMAVGPFDETIPFDCINPYWIVAELPGRGIVGCAQTLPSRPFGHLEMLTVAESLNDPERAAVTRELLMVGMALLAHNGAVRTRGFVKFSDKRFKRVLKKRGAVVDGTGNMMLRRIA